MAAQAFSSGISIKIAVRFRKSDTSGPGFGADMFGHRGHGAPDGGLLIGVGYPDGRTASNFSSRRFPEPFTPEDQPLLISGGGGGGGRTFDMEYWLTPLPPPGDVTIVVAWPAHGVDESRTVLPADAIAHGVADKVELWPWQGPEQDDEPPGIPEPTLPAGGWFAQHVSQGPRRPARARLSIITWTER